VIRETIASLNEPSIKVHQAKERPQLGDFGGWLSIKDRFDLGQVHPKLILANNVTQKST